MLPEGITLRPRTEADEPFLLALYASTREEELRPTGWSDEQKRAFVSMQFRAQTLHYDRYHPNASRQIVEREGRPVGRLWIDRSEGEINVVDIALLPEARGGGLGTALLQMVLAQAAEERRKVTIHVEQFNPALRLYRRLGFREVELRGIYWLMEWSPPQAKTA